MKIEQNINGAETVQKIGIRKNKYENAMLLKKITFSH